MDNKKYYYMRLKEDFFDTDEMKLLEAMQDGYLYSNILLKMYLKSLKGNGKLMFNNAIPYNSQMIATVTGHQVGTVERALEIFRQLGLIEVLESGAIYMIHIQNFIGKSNTEADRKRAYRKLIECEKNENLGQMSGQMSDKCPTNVLEMSPRDRDRDRDKDRDKDRDRDRDRDRVEVETKYIYCREENREAEEKSLSAFVGRADNASVLTKNVINYLNEKANKNYKSSTAKTKALINARAREGFALEDFKKVIDIKTREWKGSDMERYLRPETLFGTKFEGYLNESMIVKKSTDGSRKANELNNFYNMAAEWAAGKDDYDPATEQ